MTITLELTPEVEARLQSEARQQGLPMPDYLRQVVEAGLPRPAVVSPVRDQEEADNDLPLEEWEALWGTYLATRPQGEPLLSDEAISRASIYEERGGWLPS